MADRVKQGIDVMICHPRLVQAGLDLIDFPTHRSGTKLIIRVYVMRQASRRSWRIGQTRPVKVVFMSYKNTLQADALKLVAKKLQSSLAVEGELPEDGLAAYGDDGDDLMMALARKIVSGDEEEDEAETMEEVFAQARNAESEAEELLVDDGWKVVEVEPETIAVNGNGNGHHDLFGPTVELVPVKGHANGNGNGHAPAPVNWNGSNGHHDETPEPQQTLFSWAEFMAEEPVKPKGRGRKPQPAATSLFEWALDCGAGKRGDRAGRRGALDRNIQGEVVATSATTSPCATMYAGFFCVSARSVHVCGPFLLPIFRWSIDSSSSFALFCVRWFIWGSGRHGSQ